MTIQALLQNKDIKSTFVEGALIKRFTVADYAEIYEILNSVANKLKDVENITEHLDYLITRGFKETIILIATGSNIEVEDLLKIYDIDILLGLLSEVIAANSDFFIKAALKQKKK